MESEVRSGAREATGRSLRMEWVMNEYGIDDSGITKLREIGLGGSGPNPERLQAAMRYLRERNRYILDKPVERRPGARPHLLTLIAEQIRREREMREAMRQHDFEQEQSQQS